MKKRPTSFAAPSRRQSSAFRPGLRRGSTAHPRLTRPRSFGTFAELVGVHREALLRVVREQVADPAEIEAVLDGSPVPDRDGDHLAEAVGRVSGAHSQALILLGRDFDAWAAAR